MVVEAERGLSARTNATVGELLDRWLELARVDFSPKTTREVAGYIERNLRPALGDVRLNKLTAASLDRYYRKLLTDGGKNGRPLAPGTIRPTASSRRTPRRTSRDASHSTVRPWRR